ncbi:hypothetical protein HQ529_06465 [Candidatus Woesearchaeota archaeon]|nr:hypothetical protein [Candidatus Woesearchaeota archaeon]
MRKILGLMIIGLLISTSLVMALPKSMNVAKLRFLDEQISVGDELIASFNLENDDLPNMKNVKVTVLIYDLNLRKRVGPFDLNRNKEVTRKVLIDVPSDTDPGYYAARVTVSNDDYRRVKHRFVYIGPRIVFTR